MDSPKIYLSILQSYPSNIHRTILSCFQDLISLLDAGINADHPSVIIDADAMFSEDMFGYAAQSRAARSSGSYNDTFGRLFE